MTRRATPEAADLDGLATEAWNAAGADLDLRSTAELVALMNERGRAGAGRRRRRDRRRSRPPSTRSWSGSRTEGASSTSGRARRGGSQPSTQPSARRRSASRPGSSSRSSQAAPGERRRDRAGGGGRPRRRGASRSRSSPVGEHDAVVGLSASGRTPFTCGALEAARAAGATTVAVVSAAGSELGAAGRPRDRRRRSGPRSSPARPGSRPAPRRSSSST